MSNLYHLHTAAKGGAQVIHNLPPLPEPKNPVVAFILGFFFGALGVAIYFKSPRDFFVCCGLFVGLSILIPGIGSIAGWLFSPCYGAYRAMTSNEQLGL